MDEDFIGQLVESKKRSRLLMQRIPAVVGEYDATDSSNGKKAGLQFLDKITSVDSFPVSFYDDISGIPGNKKETTGYITH